MQVPGAALRAIVDGRTTGDWEARTMALRNIVTKLSRSGEGEQGVVNEYLAL